MDRFENLLSSIIEFREERDWKKFHTPENLAKSISIEAGELLEHFQWGDITDKNEITDELADVLIYSFLLADSLQVNIFDIVNKKIDNNRKRFPVERVKGNSGKYTKVNEDSNEYYC